jgi:hypothetical protein
MHPHDRDGRKVTELKFSVLEVQAIWEQTLAAAEKMSAEEFEKAFAAALRRRAMLKLHMFSGEGLEVSLATGRNWAAERWFANESFDGGIVLTLGGD